MIVTIYLMYKIEYVLSSGESRLKYLVAEALEGSDFAGLESSFRPEKFLLKKTNF